MRSMLTALQEGRLFELPEAGKDRALEFLARVLDANPDIVVGTDTVEEIKLREQECNTGIGYGVAVPHMRSKREDGELFCAIGWSSPGIDYGSPDGAKVYLVFMYYIPGAQKNVYLKEISSLVKAMKKTGGIERIAHAESLFNVRNLLLDWVAEASGNTGPDAVARMIKLDVKQTLAAPAAPAAPTPAGATTLLTLQAARPSAKATPLTVLATGANGVIVLAQDPELTADLEREHDLAQRISSGIPFTVAGRQIFVTNATAFPGGRTLYQGVAITAPAPA